MTFLALFSSFFVVVAATFEYVKASERLRCWSTT